MAHLIVNRHRFHKALVAICLIWIFFSVADSEININSANASFFPLSGSYNGIVTFDDKSDGITTFSNGVECSAFFTKCQFDQNHCLMIHKCICNGSILCDDIDLCDVGCRDYYRCRNNSCIKRSTVCDGDRLNGCPEDDGWQTGIGFQCVRDENFCRIPQQLLLDDVQDCDQGEDLCFDWPEQGTNRSVRITSNANSGVATFNPSRCFTCLDGSMMIPRQKVCDDIIDCSDLSDECLCTGRLLEVCEKITLRNELLTSQTYTPACDPGLFDCGDGKCINRTSICDGIKDCNTTIDERYSYCRGTLSCRDGMAEDELGYCRCDDDYSNIVGVLCDGIGHCPPRRSMVDTSYSARITWAIPPGFSDDECEASCLTPSTFNCTTSAESVKGERSLNNFYRCNTSFPIDNGVPAGAEGFKFGEVYENFFCDGIPHCSVNLENELDSSCADRFNCSASGLISIAADQVCDGTIDCDDGSDETNTTCSNRFFCSALDGTKISIDERSLCDFILNCDNGQDELYCTEDGRFYCESGTPLFVRRQQIFDGVPDCSDESDECPMMSENQVDDPFSSRYELIANPILRTLVWLMAILALGGNTVVIVKETLLLHKMIGKSVKAPYRTNHMLIWNLALADFFVGVYLLIIGIAGLVFSGSFCTYRLRWYSGLTCTFIGTLLVIASEVSVLTLVLLTTFRLYAVFWPFEACNKPSAKLVMFLIALTWCLSIFAIIPIFLERYQYVFSNRAVVPDNVFFGDIIVDFDEARTWLEKLPTYKAELQNVTVESLYEIQNATSWNTLQMIATVFGEASQLNHTALLGYFSESSVCLPRILTSHEDRAWPYTLGLIIFNFLAFIYVLCVYVSILWKYNFEFGGKESSSSKYSSAAQKQSTSDMQKKIFRLVATDFCCWVPISIMEFIHFNGITLPPIAYVIAAIVLLPINSALNPIMYSNTPAKFLKLAQRLSQANRRLSQLFGKQSTEPTANA